MPEMKMSLETSADMQQKIARAFGLDQPSTLDAVKRSDFDSDESYLNACTIYEMQRSSPEYQNTRHRLQAELDDRREREERAAQNASYKQIRSNITLDYLDHKQIDAQATDRARADLAAGRIAASDLGATIERYADELGEARKDEKAANQLFNGIIRGNR